MTQYSGRTTAYEHKNDKTWTNFTGPFPPAIVTKVVFNVQWSECPVEVEAEVKKLWKHQELKNGTYFSWDRDEEYLLEDDDDDVERTQKDVYPLIDEYLMSKRIKECEINWWW